MSILQPLRLHPLLMSSLAVALALGGAAQAADSPEVAAARAAIARMGVRAQRVDLSIRPAAHPTYRVRIRHGAIAASGSSPIALVHGVAQALEAKGKLHLSWEGRRAAPLSRADNFDSGEVSSPFDLRAYLNTCTYGYTTPWWDWARWSSEIDWMAAHGVDTPLAMEGQEYVWRALWREEGMDEAAIGQSLSAAPFLPWQRMGNIAGYRAPLSPGWIEKKHQLQIRILGRMRSLGMKPVLPAFAGYVPETFAKAHLKARIYKMRSWEGFPPTYWLDPSDPLFTRLAKRFIEIYNATYGAGDYYLADAFNEMVPPIAEDGSDAANAQYGDAIANTAAANTQAEKVAALPPAVRDARLAAYGEKLYHSITAAAPNATWVMQGWLFGADKAFWTPDAVRAFLSKVPDEKMLVLDIGNDRYPGIWQQTQAFYGKQWVYGYVHNYGGSNPAYGDLGFYKTDIAAALNNPARGHMAGFGLFPEGLHSNSIVYAYAYDLAWGPKRDLGEWLKTYTAARYGSTSPALVAAWQGAISGAYQTRYWTPRWWNQMAGAYLFFKRPSLSGADYPAAPGDPAALRRGIEAMLAAAPAHPSALFAKDIVDLTRHYASMRLDDRLKAALAAYKAGDVAGGDKARAQISDLARKIDTLAANQQETLASWVKDARAYGDTPQEKADYATQAKAIVTIWGGTGHLSDYASRAWSGLYADYYLPRWQMMLEDARAAALAHRPLDEAAAIARIRAWEEQWVANGKDYAHAAPTDPVRAAAQMLKELP